MNTLTCTAFNLWDRRGRYRMGVEFTSTCAISAYNH